MRPTRYFPLLLALAALFGCGGQQLDSHWRDRKVSIDGQDTEWEDARFLLRDSRAGLGLMNDGEYLYLTLILTDPALQAQVMRRGFTVWLDPRGGKKETFGIRFPLGMMGMARGRPSEARERPPETGERPPQDSDQDSMPRRERLDAQQLQAMFDRLASAPEMLLLGPGQGQRRRVLFSESKEILLKTSYERGRLVYEMRVPLAAAVLGAQPVRLIGLGFETPELDLAAFRQRRGGMEGGMPGVGRGGGMGGGMDGGRDGGRGGGRPGGSMGNAEAESFRLWTKVQLAAGPASGQR